jgi:hypothetical protein
MIGRRSSSSTSRFRPDRPARILIPTLIGLLVLSLFIVLVIVILSVTGLTPGA